MLARAKPAQVALAWTMRGGNLSAIPKAGTVAHVLESRAAADLVLSDADFAVLEASFSSPNRRHPLEIL